MTTAKAAAKKPTAKKTPAKTTKKTAEEALTDRWTIMGPDATGVRAHCFAGIAG